MVEDLGNKWTEERLAALEKRIHKVYSDAVKDLEGKSKAYFDQFAKRDAEQKKKLDEGKITQKEYDLWRIAQIGRGKRFEKLRDECAKRMNKANEVAAAYINDTTPGIYSLNHNYAAYTIEQVAGDVGFTIYDEQTVKRLIEEDPTLLPKRRVNAPVDLKWNRDKFSSEITSGILQGESIKKLADRVQPLSDANRAGAIRNARTAVTGAQNAGRQESYNRAKEMGLKLRKLWIATKDGRTRHEHAMLDGQTVALDEPFMVEGHKIMFPGDPTALPRLVWNCRCTMRTVEKEGIEAETRQMRARDPETGRNVLVNEMTFQEWEKWVQKRQYSDIIGESTKDGVFIKTVSSHTIDRAGERGISQKDVLDAIKNPIYVGETKTDDNGRKSRRFIGSVATVNVNPDNGAIVTVWKTGKNTRDKYKNKEEV